MTRRGYWERQAGAHHSESEGLPLEGVVVLRVSESGATSES